MEQIKVFFLIQNYQDQQSMQVAHLDGVFGDIYHKSELEVEK